MGWLELLGWCKALKRQREGAKPSPDSWATYDPWFDEQRRLQHDEARGY